MWNFHVYDFHVTHRYYIILGRAIFSELKIDLCLSGIIIRGNVGAYKGFMASMKEFWRINFNTSFDWLKW